MMAGKLLMLGTGNAMATRCYNTCFAVCTEGGDWFLTDAGGGNGILRRLDDGGVAYNRLHHMFVTHGHTDHVLGVIWVIRKIASLISAGAYQGVFHIYCHDVVKHILLTMTQMLLKKKETDHIGRSIMIHEIKDGESVSFLGLTLTAFDIFSVKAKQFGYVLYLPDHIKLVCLGDEPYHERCRRYAENADWLLAEAFCLHGDQHIFRPYEKSHSTARDAAAAAESLHAGHLVLYHTEDKTLADRKARYTAEAKACYSGEVYVPDDMECIMLSP